MYAQLTSLVLDVAGALDVMSLVANDPVPEDEEVKAGWTAFALFGLLILAVVVLSFSLVKRLRNAENAAAQGLYDPSDPKPKRRGFDDLDDERPVQPDSDADDRA